METILKINSIKKDSNCNCIDPFNINKLDGINPITGKRYTSNDHKIIKSTIFRISKERDCEVGVCCDPNDSYDNINQEFIDKFKRVYPSVKVYKKYGKINYILLSKKKNHELSDSNDGWEDPTPYLICKITKSTIKPTNNENIFVSTNLVSDCFTDSCDNTEKIQINQILNKSKSELSYSSFDDARVSQAILEGNMNYLDEYIRQYETIDNVLTHDNYHNRMIHMAASSKYKEPLNLILALKPNIDPQNIKGETPLHLAVKNNHIDNVDTLIKFGSNINTSNNYGETPIFYAVKKGNLSMIRLLYSNGSSVLNVDNNSNNLIHHCIKYSPSNNDKGNIIIYLLERGVNSESKNKKGETPLMIVKQKINNEEKQNETFSVVNHDTSKLSKEHQQLLEIQTSLFNSILKNNPDKYNKFINVKDLPIGAPIEVLDTVCVGDGNITGNEDLHECKEKGGKIVKIKEPTTKIKLELIPNTKTSIDTINSEELYFNKKRNKFDINDNFSLLVNKYNDSTNINDINNKKKLKKKDNNTNIKKKIIVHESNNLDSKDENKDINSNNINVSNENDNDNSESKISKIIKKVKIESEIDNMLKSKISNDDDKSPNGFKFLIHLLKYYSTTLFVVGILLLVVICILFYNYIQ
tara:strand:- start:6956 stop:8875 length:1920 start_codon:yes stop_codon:yes gene_type:complete